MSGFHWDKIALPTRPPQLLLLLLVFSQEKRQAEVKEEGTKAKVCFGINEMDELPFQMAKQCLHS